MTIVPKDAYPFSILLETLDKLSNAQQAIHFYRRQGLSSFWVKVDLGTLGIKYRLFTGVFASEAAAKAFLIAKHLPGKPLKRTPYASRIGIFKDQAELAAVFAKTAQAGVIPYILSTKDGPFFLYVGAFYTLDGAENQCRELVDKGLPCQAVPRSTLPL